jgi:RNA recognition motif-containing protein
MNLYVGNLSFKTTDASLKEVFSTDGQIESARVVMDRDTGSSKGFGFVEMPNREEAMAAIGALNGTDLDGRSINVNEARPKPEGGERRSSGGGGFGGGNRGGGFGGGGSRRSY